jgi:predicted Zn finger-like uncharacterized protein
VIRVRCPHCATVFRASPDVLKQRAGKVRCGKCNEIFNGLDCLLIEAPTVEVVVPIQGFTLAPPPAGPMVSPSFAVDSLGEAAALAEPKPLAPPDEAPAIAPTADAAQTGEPAPEESAPVASATAEAGQEDTAGDEPVADHSLAGDEATAVGEDALAANMPVATNEDSSCASPENVSVEEVVSSPSATDDALTTDGVDAAAEPADPVVEAQAAGLVAARDLTELPGYSKWAEGALSAPGANFEEPHKTGWMMVLLAAVLSLMLLVQAVHFWRTDIANRWPNLRPWLEEACAAIECQVPYPRDASQIHLEASDLQVDPERNNMLVLNITLKNRAPYPQDYPTVELTLTDARDQVVVRRGLAPAEWLPPKIDGAAPPPAFAAEREIAARQWVDANGTGAVGYRLYVYYP